MRTEKEIRELYSKLKSAEGKRVHLDENTWIELSEDHFAVKILAWVLGDSLTKEIEEIGKIG